MNPNEIKQMKPLLIQNPFNQKWYNMFPLFYLLNTYDNDFVVLAGYLEKAGEILPFLIESEEHSRLDIINASQAINDLKRAFREIIPL